jgi:hypothetical protein
MATDTGYLWSQTRRNNPHCRRFAFRSRSFLTTYQLKYAIAAAE